MKFLLVGARFENGKTRFYPVTHNLQQNGILRYSVMNLNFPQQSQQQKQAEIMLAKINMDKLDYVGNGNGMFCCARSIISQ